jgi:hypothetical protein
MYKIAQLFKKNGYKTSLFAMCEKDRFERDFYSGAFNQIVCSNFQFFKPSIKLIPYFIKRTHSLLKFLILLKFSCPSAVIGISGVNWQLRLAHKYFFKKIPFIYFPYDILSHYIGLGKLPPAFELQAERYCFEHADGIIHKGDPNELKTGITSVHKGINICKNQISFLPYCSEEFILPFNKDKLSNKDNEIHVVYVGFFFNDPESSQGFVNIFKDLLSQKIHVHLYTQATHLPKKEEKDYNKNLFGPLLNNSYFHVHNPLNPKEIISEISKYDYGIWPIPEISLEGTKFFTGNKISTHLEAGTPLIYDSQLEFVDNLMKKYSLNFSFNKTNATNLKEKISKKNYPDLEKNVENMRNDFLMEKNFPRLEQFIQKIIQEKN